MNRIRLIKVEDIVSSSTLDTNVSMKLLGLTLDNVQEIQLKPILGPQLYGEVLTAVKNHIEEGDALNDAMKALIYEFIRPFLIHSTVCDFIITNHFRITNKGVLLMRDDASTTADASAVKQVLDFHQQYTAQYKANLIEHLNKNEKPQDSTDRDTTTASIGWYL